MQKNRAYKLTSGASENFFEVTPFRTFNGKALVICSTNVAYH